MAKSTLRVGIAQIAPVWLQRDETIRKIIQYIAQASQEGADLVAFGEALCPGYPFWIEHTNGAVFESQLQKQLYAHYLTEAVCVERGDLKPICEKARETKTAVALGIIEAPRVRGHSCYASAVYINEKGEIKSIHRKLMPTFDERLVWATGDGHGLVTHALGPFTVGVLNCWENWMPLARASLYAQGENLHVALWPGSERNTRDLTPIIAREGRNFVISVSGLLRKSDLDDSIPLVRNMLPQLPDVMANGGSGLCGPDGQWIIEPMRPQEMLTVTEIDLKKVLEERQNFDPCGHYSRPDVLQLKVNRTRQQTLTEE